MTARPDRPTPPADCEPFMLVGSERSGTTLLRLMLDHHPEIACLPEFELVVDRVGDGGDWPPIAEFHRWLRTHRDFLEYDLRIDPSLDYPALVGSFLAQKRERDRKPLVGATVHRHFDRLLALWPRARFVHLVRDGRDVASSAVAMGWAGNTWCGADRWVEAERLWDRMTRRVPPERRTDVRYEDLVADPAGTLTRVCAFLGVAFDAAMFDYAKTTSYGMPDAGLAFQWRRRSEDDVRLAEARMGDLLAERGYPPSGLPPLEVGPRLQRRLRREDRLARWKARLALYGPRLFAEDFLSRRLGLRPWQEAVRLRLNAAEEARLR